MPKQYWHCDDFGVRSPVIQKSLLLRKCVTTILERVTHGGDDYYEAHLRNYNDDGDDAHHVHKKCIYFVHEAACLRNSIPLTCCRSRKKTEFEIHRVQLMNNSMAEASKRRCLQQETISSPDESESMSLVLQRTIGGKICYLCRSTRRWLRVNGPSTIYIRVSSYHVPLSAPPC